MQVADIFEAAATAACNDFGVPSWTKDPMELINSENVDAVIICSPTDQVRILLCLHVNVYVCVFVLLISCRFALGAFFAFCFQQHAEQIIACARNRKYCFCEKPVSLDLNIIDEVVREIEQHNAFCMVGFNRRFDTNFMRVKKAIEDGEVGDVHMVHIVSRDPGPPPLAYIAVSGGLHNDMAVRLLLLLLLLSSL